jgi:heptosyltransferase I
MIDAYGNPGEDYPLDMVYREGRLPRITVDDVASKLAQWKTSYRDARLAELASRAP